MRPADRLHCVDPADWMRERGGARDEPLFPTRTGRRPARTPSMLASRPTKQLPPTLPIPGNETGVTPHPPTHLRHDSFPGRRRRLRHRAVARPHHIRSTQAYLHADLTIKERALARTTPATSKPGRYHPPDSLLAFLEGLRRPDRSQFQDPENPSTSTPPGHPSARCRDHRRVGISR